MNVLRPILLTLTCLVAQPGLATDLPSLGDASSAIVSPLQEHQLGRAWLSLLRGQIRQLSDPQLKNFVESSVYRLGETSELQDRRLEFVLLDSPQINAFAAPGGIASSFDCGRGRKASGRPRRFWRRVTRARPPSATTWW